MLLKQAIFSVFSRFEEKFSSPALAILQNSAKMSDSLWANGEKLSKSND
jgi:hypothetical protein